MSLVIEVVAGYEREVREVKGDLRSEGEKREGNGVLNLSEVSPHGWTKCQQKNRVTWPLAGPHEWSHAFGFKI